jgi:hypothetical protein
MILLQHKMYKIYNLDVSMFEREWIFKNYDKLPTLKMCEKIEINNLIYLIWSVIHSFYWLDDV